MSKRLAGWSERRGLPVLLLAAVLQSWSLYALHRAARDDYWPATEPAWLLALYAVALVVPLSMQMLAEYASRRSTWVLIAALGLAWFGFGWWHGAYMGDEKAEPFGETWELFIQLELLWAMLLPFLQVRIDTGRWWPEYTRLFVLAWRNHLVLAEALLFTGLFWGLLWLWAALFDMLGIRYFSELFREAIFVYSVTPLAFGIALHLIGSVEQLSKAVLEQVLGVLKWLLPLAAVILAAFSIALLFRFPVLIEAEERAISAAVLLWLVAMIVLFVNAAWRDGSGPVAYPATLANAIRLAVPLLALIAATAIWAVGVRLRHYGWTADRVWAMVVAVAALAYALGYGGTAVRRGAWLQGLAP